MLPLRLRVVGAIERDALAPHGTRLMVAVSGGGDSVALAGLLHELAPDAPWTLAGLLHLNHRLRGAESDTDERCCRELARALGMPITVERVDVAARARADGVSLETAGHRARYALFDSTVASGAADRVATAHTRDDLAETVLLRLIRGAGPGGLSGIHPRSGHVVRPLLDVSRAELRGYLAARALPYRDDPTNDDLSVTRNRIRHRLLPYLAEQFSPAVTVALAREAAIARADAAWMDAAARAAAERVGVTTASGESAARAETRIDAGRLAAEPPALGRRIARMALERAGGRRVGLAHVERLLRMAADAEGPPVADFPGCRASRDGSTLVLGPPPARSPVTPVGFIYQLTVPGEVAVPEAGVRLSVTRAERAPALAGRGETAVVRAEAVVGPLTVRSWRPGDRFQPLGLGGRKKLQDFFIDRKITREQRPFVPIVADASGRIVWVAQHAVAEDFRVTDLERGVLILKVMKSGGHE